MKMTRIILVVFFVLLTIGLTGCTETTVRNDAPRTELYVGHRGPTQSPWWQDGGIDIDWPY